MNHHTLYEVCIVLAFMMSQPACGSNSSGSTLSSRQRATEDNNFETEKKKYLRLIETSLLDKDPGGAAFYLDNDSLSFVSKYLTEYRPEQARGPYGRAARDWFSLKKEYPALLKRAQEVRDAQLENIAAAFDAAWAKGDSLEIANESFHLPPELKVRFEPRGQRVLDTHLALAQEAATDAEANNNIAKALYVWTAVKNTIKYKSELGQTKTEFERLKKLLPPLVPSSFDALQLKVEDTHLEPFLKRRAQIAFGESVRVVVEPSSSIKAELSVRDVKITQVDVTTHPDTYRHERREMRDVERTEYSDLKKKCERHIAEREEHRNASAGNMITDAHSKSNEAVEECDGRLRRTTKTERLKTLVAYKIPGTTHVYRYKLQAALKFSDRASRSRSSMNIDTVFEIQVMEHPANPKIGLTASVPKAPSQASITETASWQFFNGTFLVDLAIAAGKSICHKAFDTAAELPGDEAWETIIRLERGECWIRPDDTRRVAARNAALAKLALPKALRLDDYESYKKAFVGLESLK